MNISRVIMEIHLLRYIDCERVMNVMRRTIILYLIWKKIMRCSKHYLLIIEKKKATNFGIAMALNKIVKAILNNEKDLIDPIIQNIYK